jgi:3-dehydroquinate synthetase
MAAAGVERDGRVLAIGGGVTTDLAGLAASLYMRGIAWEAAPTTLLAQVDASVGGKTAINGRAGKNLFGTFHAPRDVWIDPLVLATLTPGDWRSGLGEVLKAALLGARLDDGMLLFDTLEARTRAPLAGDPPTSRLDGNVPPRAQLAALAPLLTACLRLKAELVDADFREAGVRAHLNLGHTFGHGIEAASRYRVPHGIAVATGIGMALETARMRGVLEELALAERTARLTTALGLPADLAALNAAFGLALTPSDVHAHMGLDKKKRAGQLRLVLPQALGRVTVIATDAP